MLGKLLKYELRASGRKFLPFYLAILAVSAFQKVSKQSPHYNDSRWYEALALIKAGKTAEGKRILTDLLKAGYYRSGEVKSLNDRTSRLLH